MKIHLFLCLFLVGLLGCSSDHSEKNIYSLVVSKNGKLVKEEYYNGKKKTDKLNVQSITKSIISLLTGIAIDKGFIESEETLVSQYFPESPFFSDENKNHITVKHLLNHTAGFDWKGYKEHKGFLNSDQSYEFVLEKNLVANPGASYNYNSGGTHLLSVILTKATGMSTLEFANKYLFNPLAITSIEWKKLNDGYYDGAGLGLSMNSNDLLKIGQLVLNKGTFNSNQLISKTWMNKSFDESMKNNTKWGLRKSKHGFGWYSKTKDDEQILYSMGYGGQFIFILPTTELIIVTTHNPDVPTGIEQQVDFIVETFPALIEEFGG